ERRCCGARGGGSGATSGGVAFVEHRIFTTAAGGHNVPRLGDLAVAVGVEHLAAPAHGFLLVVGCVVDFGVDPADDGAGEFVEIHGLIGVVIELQVMRREAGVDQRELL